jgi:hypothetical protein
MIARPAANLLLEATDAALFVFSGYRRFAATHVRRSPVFSACASASR